MKNNIVKSYYLGIILILSLSYCINKSEPKPQFTITNNPLPKLVNRNQTLEEFRNSKFGMFIHFGVYSQIAKGEWIMLNDAYRKVDYRWVAKSFNPTDFNAQQIVALAKNSGMKYITFTSKHHDGFCMFKTQYTKYNIVDYTQFGRDPLKELSEECQKQGIRLYIYYSLMDWHHNDYTLTSGVSKLYGEQATGNWDNYIAYMKNQLTELLTNYGDVGGIWFDGYWDDINANWRIKEIYDHIHKVKPTALVGNNHHLDVIEGEDFQMFERDLPGEFNSNFNNPNTKISTLPLETCETLNKSWGFVHDDNYYKSPADVIKLLLKANGKNANLLLNVGPDGKGNIPDKSVETLKAVGNWLTTNENYLSGTVGTYQVDNDKAVFKSDKGFVVVSYNANQDLRFVLPDSIKIQSVTDSGNGSIKFIQKGDTIVVANKNLTFDSLGFDLKYINYGK